MSDRYIVELSKKFGLPTHPGMTSGQARNMCEQIIEGARVLTISQSDYDLLRAIQLRKRWDWPATFSTNGCHIWPFVCYGWTPRELREDVSGISSILDEVAKIYLRARGPLGGRFFINDHGAYWKDEQGNQYQFVFFKLIEEPESDEEQS